jgi:hypothetical protein
MPDFFDPNDQKGAAPQISAEYADYVRQTAAQIERDNPNNPRWQEHAAKLRRDLEGLVPPIPTDSRTAQQIAHDKRFGVNFAPDGNVKLPEVLAAVIKRDATGSAPNPTNVAEHLKAAGLEPEKVLKQAQAALDQAGSSVKADKLSAHTQRHSVRSARICRNMRRTGRSRNGEKT